MRLSKFYLPTEKWPEAFKIVLYTRSVDELQAVNGL
jgi:hypothetical protein